MLIFRVPHQRQRSTFREPISARHCHNHAGSSLLPVLTTPLPTSTSTRGLCLGQHRKPGSHRHRRRADESRVRRVHVTTSLNDHNALPKRVVRKESKQDVTVTVASSPRRRRVVAASLCWPGNPALAGGQPGRIIIGHGDLSKLQTSFVVVVVVRRRRCSSSSSVAVVVVVVATVELYVQPLSSCLSLYLFIGDALPQSRVDGTLASAC
mgnify:CR=1 FL=1